MINEDDLAVIADRIFRPLDLLLGYLSDALAEEYQHCADVEIDADEDPCTLAATVRRNVRNRLKAHLPGRPGRPLLSPVHLDLGAYQLKVLHAEDGTVPRPKTAARMEYYRRNELGIWSLPIPHPLVDIEEDADGIEDGCLVLIWNNDGPNLIQADLYRPRLQGFPGEHLDLLASTIVEVEPDFPEVRRDDKDGDTGLAATGTDDGVPGDLGYGDGGAGTGQDSGSPDSPGETDSQ